MKINVIFIFIIIIISSCQSSVDNNELRMALEKIRESSKLVNTIIIPGEGCGGCISDATRFVFDNIDSLNNTTIIFTGVLDKKLLLFNLGESFLSRPNVFVDEENLIPKHRTLGYYPLFIEIKNNKVNAIKILEKSDVKLSIQYHPFIHSYIA